MDDRFPEAWVEERYNAMIDLSVAIAALDLGLAERLRVPCSFTTLVHDLGASPRALAALLESLRRLALVTDDSGWQLTERGEALLGAGRRGRGQLAQYGFNRTGWSRLADAV
ncbi:MAG: hypothetical protein AAFV53_35995, partial [Myxococcota bacterium]